MKVKLVLAIAGFLIALSALSYGAYWLRGYLRWRQAFDDSREKLQATWQDRDADRATFYKHRDTFDQSQERLLNTVGTYDARWDKWQELESCFQNVRLYRMEKMVEPGSVDVAIEHAVSSMKTLQDACSCVDKLARE